MIEIIPDWETDLRRWSTPWRAGLRDVDRWEPELDQAEFFRIMSADRLARIRHLVFQKRVERGKLLYYEGHPAEYLWAVRTGEVRLYKSSPSGRITTLETLQPGEMFGAVSSLDQDRYTTSAEGVSDGTAWCLPRDILLKQIADDPRLAIDVLVVTSRRLRNAHDRLRSFASDRAPVRLARALLHAASEGEARITRRALAEASATTVETAIRVLRQFERKGLISGEVGRVQIVDEPALLEIAGKN